MDYVKTFDNNINDVLSQFVRKPTLIRGIIHLLLILYSARLAPSLPKKVLLLFENQYFKLFIFSLILWTAQFSPSTSILIALAFMVTVNYANQKPMWEFIENTEAAQQDSAPNAPTKEVAVAATSAIVNAQVENTPVVSSVEQKQETIVIQPKIVDTPSGPMVINPTVVVAPIVVETPSGEKIIIKPDVSTVKVEEQAAAAPQLAAAPEPAPAPAPAPASRKEQIPEPAAVQEGCYPIRKYDMGNVLPQSSADIYQQWSA